MIRPCDSDIKIRIVDIKKIITNWLSSSWLSRWDKLLESGVGGMFVVLTLKLGIHHVFISKSGFSTFQNDPIVKIYNVIQIEWISLSL